MATPGSSYWYIDANGQRQEGMKPAGTPATGGTFVDPNIERVRQEQETARTGLQGILDDARTLYQDLINKGRTADAYALRDATGKLTRIGSKLGVSSWSRTQALQDVAARMRNAAAVSENQIIAQRLAQHQSVLQNLSQVDNTAFNQAMEIAKAKMGQSQYDRSQLFEEKKWADSLAAQKEAMAKPVVSPSASFNQQPKKPTQTSFSTPTLNTGSWNRPVSTNMWNPPQQKSWSYTNGASY
jgi:hypothetical protein